MLHPLTHQSALQSVVNAVFAFWPGSALLAGAIAYCETINERLAPIHLQTEYPHA